MTDPINAEKARFTSEYVKGENGATLRIFHWQPHKPERPFVSSL